MRKSDLPACSHMRSEEKSRDIFLKADNGSETETVRSTAVAACFCFFCELRSDVFCSLWSAGEFSSTVVCISLAGQTLTRRERVW